MTSAARHLLFAALVLGLVLTGGSSLTPAQSEALNGQIEGTIVDPTGAVVANAGITVTNIETGATRRSATDQKGVYRIPLLPLGTYRITVEAPTFKRLVRDGVILATGQSATVDMRLQPGEIEETVTISGDAPIADAGKTDLGRVMNRRDVHNLPLPPRNPYNFVILQANVTGRPSRGAQFPQVNVNGFARRVNYLLDGNINTQYDRAAARLMHLSETYVNEIQLVANGFAAEFGNTTGMIMNVVTPSGTNDLHGSATYLFRRPWFYARPFFFPARDVPENVTNNVAATIGGPIIRDRWHFYFGYEYIRRDDSSQANRQVRISEANKAALIAAGLSPSVFVPAVLGQDRFSSYIVRTDVQLDDKNRLTARFNISDGSVVNFQPGGLNTMERSVSVIPTDHSIGGQLVSFTPNLLNELRIQYARRFVHYERGEQSASGPSISITNVANFGPPTDAGIVDPLINVTQTQDNLTWTGGSHVIKFGGGFSYIDSFNRDPVFSLYTFPSLSAWLAARTGSENSQYGYTRYEESFGDPTIKSNETFWNFFVQDSWKATRRLKLNYGIRYDLYVVPKADPSSPLPASRKFNIDKNNLAPRFGLVYALRDGNRPTVIRAGAGIYYEPAWLDMYDRASLNSGSARFFKVEFLGTNGGTRQSDPLAQAFPNTFSGSWRPECPFHNRT